MRELTMLLMRWTTVCTLLGALLAPAHGQEPSEREGRAGYGDIQALGGPESVAENLRRSDQEKEYRFEILNQMLTPWFDWKKRMKDEHHLALGFNAQIVLNHGNDPIGSDDTGFGGIYRFQGSWELTGRNTDTPGSLGFRVEYRNRHGGQLPPSGLKGALGIGALDPAFGYSTDFDLDLAVINWTQFFAGGRAAWAAGRLDFLAYMDPYPFQTLSQGFLNRSAIFNPTAATTGTGALGAVAKGFLTENVWLGGAFYDGNAASGDFDLDTFDSDELLKHVEIGWTPSFEQRKSSKVQLTWWEKDARPEAGVSSGDGWLLTAHHKFDNGVLPFVRIGDSDGGAGVPAEEAITIGLGYDRPRFDLFSVSLGWAKPSEETFGPGLDDEFVLETSWKFQMSPNGSILPNLQYIRNPANNPEEDSTWVASLRFRWDI